MSKISLTKVWFLRKMKKCVAHLPFSENPDFKVVSTMKSA